MGPVRRILFIEDNRNLLSTLLAIVKEERPEWQMDFADDIPSAWEKLCKRIYDLIVMDVMLPAWDKVPPRSEGIFLAKWILSIKATLQPFTPPPGTIMAMNQKAKIIFLTSRETSSVEKQVTDVIGKSILVVGRLKVDDQGQFEAIQRLLEGE